MSGIMENSLLHFTFRKDWLSNPFHWVKNWAPKFYRSQAVVPSEFWVLLQAMIIIAKKDNVTKNIE